jgi:hypothetical protein
LIHLLSVCCSFPSRSGLHVPLLAVWRTIVCEGVRREGGREEERKGGSIAAAPDHDNTYSLDDKHGIFVVVVVSPLDEDASSHARDVGYAAELFARLSERRLV